MQPRRLCSVEKEQQDNAQKLKDSQEAGQKVLELQRKLDHAREVVSAIELLLLSSTHQIEKNHTTTHTLKCQFCLSEK